MARRIGRYVLHDEIASGGMATVHFGRLLGAAGFTRTVAIKRLHPQFAKDPEFVAMFVDEARLTSRVRHANIVSTLDVVAAGGELLMVMEYVHGESLARLTRAARDAGQRIPVPIAASIISGLLHGLHAAHEATDERGAPLHIVHRDVSPQNLLVGVDGIARAVDFGVAKALGRVSNTRDGHLKGKPAYMAPEQIRAADVTRTSDVYAAGVVLWETLTGFKLFRGDSDQALVSRVLGVVIDPPSRVAPGIPAELDAIVLKATESDPALRFATAREMALALEAATPLSNPSEVAAWVETLVGSLLAERARQMIEIESAPEDDSAPKTAAIAGRSLPPEPGSLPATTTSATPRAGGRAAALLFAVVVAVAVGAWAVTRSSHSNAGPTPEMRSADPSPPPVESSSSTNEPPAPATEAPSASAAPKPKSVPAPKPPPPKPTRDCNPPYTVDEKGIHHMKRECL